MTAQGFTLTELVAVCALVSGVASVAGTIAVGAQQANRTSQRHSQQLEDARRALAAFESDLRIATGIRPTRAGCDLRVDQHDVSWSFRDAKLMRNGRTLARSIRGVNVRRIDGLFEITLELLPAHDGGSRPAPVLVSLVAPRGSR